MALSDAVKAAISRLRTFYEGTKPYNAATNPGGFQNDGHRVNFVPALQDVGSVVAAAADLVEQAAANAANSPKALRVDGAQNFADSEIAQALINIGLLADSLPISTDQKNKILANLGAAAILAAAVQKTGDTMTGPLAISFATPYFDLIFGNVIRSRQIIDGSGTWILRDGDSGDNKFYVTKDGATWTKQLGDLATYINNIGTNNQNAAVNRSVTAGRFVFAGDRACITSPGTGGFIDPVGAHGVSTSFWSWAFQTADGQSGAAPFAYRWRYFQVYIANQGWVTCGAAS